MTKKFCKEWGGLNDSALARQELQRMLDGGRKIVRSGNDVTVGHRLFCTNSPGVAVKFAAALNKLRRPLRLIKKDLDADWAVRVKERDKQTCVLCGVTGNILGRTVPAHDEIDDETGEIVHVKERTMKDVLTAHHWLKTKSHAGMARWARACGITVHYSEHIHTLHENPCWMNMEPVYRHVVAVEGKEAIEAAKVLVNVKPTEDRVRALWLERCGNCNAPIKEPIA